MYFHGIFSNTSFRSASHQLFDSCKTVSVNEVIMKISRNCNEAIGYYTFPTFHMNPNIFIFSIIIQVCAMKFICKDYFLYDSTLRYWCCIGSRPASLFIKYGYHTNSNKIHATSKFPFLMTREVPWNSMVLFVSAKLAQSSTGFHGTARVIEIGVLTSSVEFHGTARVSEIGTLHVPWNSKELLVSAKLAHLKCRGIPWNSPSQ